MRNILSLVDGTLKIVVQVIYQLVVQGSLALCVVLDLLKSLYSSIEAYCEAKPPYHGHETVTTLFDRSPVRGPATDLNGHWECQLNSNSTHLHSIIRPHVSVDQATLLAVLGVPRTSRGLDVKSPLTLSCLSTCDVDQLNCQWRYSQRKLRCMVMWQGGSARTHYSIIGTQPLGSWIAPAVPGALALPATSARSLFVGLIITQAVSWRL